MSLALLAVLSGRVAAQTSDDFNACDLDTGVWTVVDPQGDGAVSLVGAGTGDARLLMSIPGGLDHDAWATNGALRITQPISDTDFTIEAKFDSPVTAQFQDQGLLIEQGPTDFIRFDVFSDGQTPFLFAASSTAGAPTAWSMAPLPVAFPVVLRAERIGDLFTLSYGTPGGGMTVFAAQAMSLQVSAVGPYVGNFNSNPAATPAFTAAVDYFEISGDPITGEDAGAPGVPSTLTLNQVGAGTVDSDPDRVDFYCGETIELLATADTGWNFERWTGDVDSTDNPISIVMDQDVSVTAVFVQDVVPLQIANLQIVPDVYSATVTWQTNDPSTTSLSYGLSPAFELGSLGSDLLTTFHRVDLTDLLPDTTYFFELASVEPSGDMATLSGLSLTTLDIPFADITTDTFNDCSLDPVWSFLDPIGDCSMRLSGIGTDDARVQIEVPGGIAHDYWPVPGFGAPRLLQNCNDTDFTIEAKFDSLPAGSFAMQGILIVESPGNSLRFDFYSEGASTNFFAASFSAEMPVALSNIPVSSGVPLLMRVMRRGDNFTVLYSSDGVIWQLGAMFTHQIEVNQVGVFAGNAGNAPAFTAEIDYFLNLDDPFTVEDGPLSTPGTTLTVAPAMGGSVVVEPDYPLYYCSDLVEVRAVPDPGFALADWGGDLAGSSTRTESLMLDVSRSLAPVFVPDTFGPVVTNVDTLPGDNAMLVTWETDEPATWTVDYGPTMALGTGSIPGGPVSATEHSVLLTGLMPSTTYFVQITSLDEFGNSGVQTFQLNSGPPGTSPRPRINVWYGEKQSFYADGVPQPWVNILGRISGGGGITSATYSLNGAPPRVLNLGPDLRRLSRTGDFNVDLRREDLVVGSNTVTIQAVGESGLVATEVVTVHNLDNGMPSPTSRHIDFSRVGAVTEVSQPVDGIFKISPLGARTVDVGYDRFLAIGDIGWEDYEVTARVRLHSFDFPSSQTPQSGFFAAFGLLMRWPGHTVNGQQPNWQPFPLGSIGWYRFNSPTEGRFEIYGNDGFILDTDASFSPAIEQDYFFKMRVETVGSGDVMQFKAWRADQKEPAEWLLRGVQDGPTDPESGSFCLLAHHCDVTFQTVDVVPGPFVDGTPPEASAFRYLASDSVADLSWATNFESRTILSYGLTDSFELGSVVIPAPVVDHAVTLTGLLPSTEYRVRVTAEGPSKATDHLFVFSTAAPGGMTSSLDSEIFSDDFSGAMLDPLWTIQDPVGDGTVVLGSEGGEDFLEMSVPVAVDHDAWIGGNRGLRLVQPLADTNFSVVGKWLTTVQSASQFQGIMVLGDAGDFLRYDLLQSGAGPRLFAATVNGGAADVRLNQAIDPARAAFLRVSRIGDSWILSNSVDGQNWETAATFNHEMTVTDVGPYIGTASGGSSPAFTSRLDYFFNERSPIDPEDG